MSPVKMDIDAAAVATEGQILQRGAESFEGLSIDSRRLTEGQAFVAIAGDRFDGHEYVEQAIAGGARVLFLARPPAAPVAGDVSVVQVRDTRAALAALARAWRRSVAPRVVAITGSAGKTTTKELTAQILSRLGATHSTRGNFNNEIGLPLTLLEMPAGTRFLVVELGMNAPGEIARLTATAEPHVGLVTCVAPVHLSGVGSIEGVAAAKGELFEGLAPGAWAVSPGDEALLEPYLAQVAQDHRLRFGRAADDDVRIDEIAPSTEEGTAVELSLGGERISFTLPLAGEHNVLNAAAAAAVGRCLGASPGEIAAALSQAPRLEHRSVTRRIGPWRIMDDCYNANPTAMRAALSTLPQLAGAAPRVAVLGAMLELGAEAERYHREVGQAAAEVGLELLITVGAAAEAIADGAAAKGMNPSRIIKASDVPAAARLLVERAGPGAWILIKASRGARLEQILEILQAEKAPGDPQEGGQPHEATSAPAGARPDKVI